MPVALHQPPPVLLTGHFRRQDPRQQFLPVKEETTRPPPREQGRVGRQGERSHAGKRLMGTQGCQLAKPPRSSPWAVLGTHPPGTNRADSPDDPRSARRQPMHVIRHRLPPHHRRPWCRDTEDNGRTCAQSLPYTPRRPISPTRRARLAHQYFSRAP